MSTVLTAARPVAFVPSTDLERSREFYEQALGLQVVHADDFAVVLDANGFAIRVTDVGPDLRVQPFTVLGWAVDDVHAEIAELRQRGVVSRRVNGIEQDEAGVWVAPTGTKVAWFTDPDGNTLSVSGG